MPAPCAHSYAPPLRAQLGRERLQDMPRWTQQGEEYVVVAQGVGESPPPPPTGWVWPQEGEMIEVEVEGEDGSSWREARVASVLVDSWFQAQVWHTDAEGRG